MIKNYKAVYERVIKYKSICRDCGKSYQHRQSLFTHRKTCKSKISNDLLEENKYLRNRINELQLEVEQLKLEKKALFNQTLTKCKKIIIPRSKIRALTCK